MIIRKTEQKSMYLSMKNKHIKPSTPVKMLHLEPVDPVRKVLKNSHNSHVIFPIPQGWNSRLVTLEEVPFN